MSFKQFSSVDRVRLKDRALKCCTPNDILPRMYWY